MAAAGCWRFLKADIRSWRYFLALGCYCSSAQSNAVLIALMAFCLVCVRCFHGSAARAPCLRLCEPRGRHGRGPGEGSMLRSCILFFTLVVGVRWQDFRTRTRTHPFLVRWAKGHAKGRAAGASAADASLVCTHNT